MHVEFKSKNIFKKLANTIEALREVSVRNRLIIYIIVSMVVSLTIFGTFIYFKMYNNMLESTYSNISLMINQTSKNLNESFKIINYTTLGLTSTNTVKEWIPDSKYFIENTEKTYAKQAIFDNEIRSNLLFNNAWNLKLITTVSTYVNDDGISYIFTKDMPIEKFKSNSDKVFRDTRSKVDEYVYDIPPTLYDDCIYHIRRLRNPNNFTQTITFLVATKEQLIADKFEELLMYNKADVYIYDSTGTILSSNNKNILGTKVNYTILKNINLTKINQINIDGKTYIAGYKSIESNGLTLAVTIPRYIIVNQILKNMAYFVDFSIFLMIILTIIVVILMINSTKFIKDLLICINSIKNKKYNTKMPIYNNPSLDELSNAVNSMTDELNYLIKETYEKQLLIKEMNIKFLQYQMNPHFLFNILLTIQLKAKMCKDESIYKMVNSLTTLLRAGIYTNSTAKIQLKQELEYVEFYLYLQKVRFEERLEYSISIENDNLTNLYIPKLTIEPIVENAIIHGLENKVDNLVVNVNVFTINEDVCIEIIDNGSGFDVDKIINVTNDDVTQRNVKHDKIGLINTDQRLKLIYGQNYGLFIESSINNGSNIKIKIPPDTGQ